MPDALGLTAEVFHGNDSGEAGDRVALHLPEYLVPGIRDDESAVGLCRDAAERAGRKVRLAQRKRGRGKAQREAEGQQQRDHVSFHGIYLLFSGVCFR